MSVRAQPSASAAKEADQIPIGAIVSVRGEDFGEGGRRFYNVEWDRPESDGMVVGWVKEATRGWAGIGAKVVLSLYNEPAVPDHA